MKNLIVLATFLVATAISIAQPRQTDDYQIIKSDIQKNKKPYMYTDEFLGEEDGVVYVLQTSRVFKIAPAYELRVQMLNKDDMSNIKSAPLLSLKNKSQEKKYKDLYYYDHMINKNGVYFFFRKKGKKNNIDVYLASYTLNMRPKEALKKVLSYNTEEIDFYGLMHDDYPNIVLMSLNRGKRDEPLNAKYKVLNQTFEVVKSGKIDIPYTRTKGGNGWFGKAAGKNRQAFASNLRLDSKGNVLTSVSISQGSGNIPTKKERKKNRKASKYKDQIHRAIVVLNTTDESFTEIPIKLGGKLDVRSFMWITSGEDISVTGFYTNRRKDKKGNEYHGVFYMRVDLDKKEMVAKRSVEFPQDFLKRVNSLNTLGKKRKNAKETAKGSINEGFDMVDIILDPKERSLTAYCEPIYNYSVTTCNDKGGCTTTYYTERGTAFYFKVNNKGEFKYYNAIRKYNKWSSGSSSIWYKKSMHVYRSPDGKTDYLMYYTSRKYDEKNKRDLKGVKLKYKKTIRNFVVAEIDQEHGNYILSFPRQFKKKQKDHYQVKLGNVVEMDGDLYSFATKRTMKPHNWAIMAVIALPTFFIGPYFMAVSPKSYWEKVQYHRVVFDEEPEDDDDY